MTVPMLPLTLITSLNRTLEAAVAPVPSAFTGSEQVQDWGGRWWRYEIEMGITKGRDARILSVFFASLGGAAGRFLLADPSAADQSSLPGTPGVSGAGQSGTTLATTGWDTETAPQIGDLFSLGADENTRFYQFTADVTPDAGGAATIAFVPALRTNPADGAALNITAPMVCLRLEGPVPTRITRADSHRYTLTAREAF